MRIMINSKEAPGVATNNPRSETHSGAVTPECGPSCNSTCAPPKRKWAPMDMRELRALQIAAGSKITVSDGGIWTVPSQSGTGNYNVTLGETPTCTCDDFALRKEACKHVIAAKLVCARDHGGNAPVIVADKVPKRPTYRQNWPLYNLAQATEKHRFQELLFDLLKGIEEPDRSTVRGQKPHSLRDQIFAMTY